MKHREAELKFWTGFFCLLLLLVGRAELSAEETRAAFNALSGRFLPLWVAKEAGVFERHQLSASLVYVGGPLAAPVLAAGEVEFAVMGGSTALFGMAAGMDLVMLASIMNQPDLYIVARPGVRAPGQLRGLHVGVGRFGGEPDFLLRYSLKQCGLAPDRDVRISQLFGSHPERMAAVLHGRIDATVITPPITFQARKLGLELIHLNEPGDHYLGVALVTRRSSIQKNEERVRRFARAFVEGLRLAKSDTERAAAALKKYTGLHDSHVLHETARLYARMLRPHPTVLAESVRLLLSMMDKRLEVARSFDNRFVEAAR